MKSSPSPSKWVHRDRTGLIAAGVAGFLLFWWRFGLGIVNPGHIEWMLGRGDTGFNQLAWMFFRSEGWHWPPGSLNTFMAPYGTTVGLTDSLPLFALPFKLLAFLLPTPFQYFGLWMLVTHILMVVFCWQLCGVFFRSLWPRVLGTGLLTLYPVFLIRDDHTALMALWVLPATLWFYLGPGPDRTSAPARWWLILLGVAAWIHPYSAVYVFMFLLADQARRLWVTRETTLTAVLLRVGGLGAALVLLWYLVGFFRPGELPYGTIPGDVKYTADFQAMVNSQGRTLVPGLPVGGGDLFEGFNYFGAGGVLAVLAALVLGGWRQVRGKVIGHWPLVAILTVTTLFAWGLIPGSLDQQFRAPGRFLWPVFYVLVTLGLAAVARQSRSRNVLALMALLFVVQAVDVAPIFDQKQKYAALGFTSRLQDPQWKRAVERADMLLVSPSTTHMTVFENDFIDLTLLARETGIPTTAGFATRSYRKNYDESEKLTREFLFSGQPDTGTVGVIRRSHFAEMFPLFAQSLRCTDLDGFPVCFARRGGFVPDEEFQVQAVTLEGFLSEHLGQTLVLVGKGDTAGRLTAGGVRLLAESGSKVAHLPGGASYVGIFVHGAPVFERMHPETAVTVTAAKNNPMGPLRMLKQLEIASSGNRSGAYASLTVDGQEILFNREGLNIAVLDDRQEVVTVATFCPPQAFSNLASPPEGLTFTLVDTAGN